MRWSVAAYVGLLLVIVALADLGALGPVLVLVHAHGADKVAHFAFALGLGLVLTSASRRPARGVVLAAPFVVGEELSQLVIPGRSFDLGDLAADALGLVMGMVIVLALRRARVRRDARDKSA